MKQLHLLFLVLLALIVNCSGLYFHIAETERKCFIEEIPDETTVIGNFFIFILLFPENAKLVFLLASKLIDELEVMTNSI